jgi:hypothetical protein
MTQTTNERLSELRRLAGGFGAINEGARRKREEMLARLERERPRNEGDAALYNARYIVWERAREAELAKLTAERDAAIDAQRQRIAAASQGWEAERARLRHSRLLKVNAYDADKLAALGVAVSDARSGRELVGMFDDALAAGDVSGARAIARLARQWADKPGVGDFDASEAAHLRRRADALVASAEDEELSAIETTLRDAAEASRAAQTSQDVADMAATLKIDARFIPAAE